MRDIITDLQREEPKIEPIPTVTITLEDYEQLLMRGSDFDYFNETLDMICDAIKTRASLQYSGVRDTIYTRVRWGKPEDTLDEILRIIQYRHRYGFAEINRYVDEAMKRRKEEDLKEDLKKAQELNDAENA